MSLCDLRNRGATVYTDEASAYEGLTFEHESVKHSVGEYARGVARTNGVEDFWSGLKRAHLDTYRKMSPKHLDRYVTEFEGRHNMRGRDTIAQMGAAVLRMDCKRLGYDAVSAPKGLASGARGQATPRNRIDQLANWRGQPTSHQRRS